METHTLTDDSLLAGLGSGDPAAATAFVERFERRVYGLTLSILRDPGAAEDAAQETFVRAWRHAETFDPRRGSVAGWLLTIARNVSFNMLPNRRLDAVDPADLLERGVGLGVDPHRNGEADAPLEDGGLVEAVRRLPMEQRRVLLMAVFYGYTAAEMSRFDHVPLGTVKTRIRAALTKLRSELGVRDVR
jgi:RNA polymerase sigma-70 factor (ECF subfamily)